MNLERHTLVYITRRFDEFCRQSKLSTQEAIQLFPGVSISEVEKHIAEKRQWPWYHKLGFWLLYLWW